VFSLIQQQHSGRISFFFLFLLITVGSSVEAISGVSSSDWGEPLAWWNDLVATGQHINYQEEKAGYANLVGRIEEATGEEKSQLTELGRYNATQILVQKSLAADAKKLKVSLSQNEKRVVQQLDLQNTLTGWFSHLRHKVLSEQKEQIEKQLEQTLKNSEESKALEPLYKIRLLFRRSPGPEGEKPEEFLQKLRQQILEGDITIEEAIRRYSQAPSAPQSGVLPMTPFTRLPPVVAELVKDLEEGQWSEVGHSEKGGAFLVQLIVHREPTPTVRDEVRERLMLDAMKKLEVELLGDNPSDLDRQAKAIELGIPLPYPPGCIQQWESQALLAEKVLDASAKIQLGNLAGVKRKELFEKFRKNFRRLWVLERNEYYLEPDPERRLEASRLSMEDVQRIWKEDRVWLYALQLDPGVHSGGPIPAGWQMRIKPILVHFPIEPSPETPQPLQVPVWRKGKFFAEGEATIYPMGDPEKAGEEYLTFEELETEQIDSVLNSVFQREIRLERRYEVESRVHWMKVLQTE
jgi:hypothetical protein